MDIFEVLSGQLNNKGVIDELSKSTKADAAQVEGVLKLGVPTLIEAMNKNAKSTTGASSLAKALDDHKNANVDDVLGFLKNVDTKEGAKILGHVFGSDNKKVQNNISAQTGLKTNQVLGVLSKLAPLLMGLLGKEKSSNNVKAGDLTTMLGKILKSGESKGFMETVTNMLDLDDDGKIIDDLSKLAGGMIKK